VWETEKEFGDLKLAEAHSLFWNQVTGAGVGFFNGGVIALPGHPPGSRPFFQVRGWDSQTGPTFDLATIKWCSTVFQLGASSGPGGVRSPPAPPSSLIGLHAYLLGCDIREPGSSALGIIAGLAFTAVGFAGSTAA
jgi:hypothetical protein